MNAASPIYPFFLDLDENEIDSLQREFGEILRSGQLILGKHTQSFEDEFAKYTGSKYAVTLNTATSALEILCVVNGAKGKKIAVPSNTNFATVAAIIRAGGVPVFMDMTKEYFVPNLDILKHTVEKYGVEGVMWVHIGGLIVPDFPQIVDFCRSKELFLIEDCAHAHGSWLDGSSAGTFADGGAFSFFPTKVMTTMEGGMLVTDNKEHAELAKSLRNQGKRGAAYGGLHSDLGNSWRMTEIAAYMGLIQLAKLDHMVAVRQSAVDIVSMKLDEIGVEYCNTSHMDKSSHYKFMVHLPEELGFEMVKEKLKSLGVICGGGVYEVPCHRQPVFQNIPYELEELDVTEKWCPRHICPPITSGTSASDAGQIAAAVAEVVG